MSASKISKRLQNSILIYSALGIFAISVVVALVSILPLYQQLKQETSRNLIFALKTRTLTIEQYLARTKDIALQIASRTKAREQLELYNQRKIRLEEFANVSKGILADALTQSQDLVGIIRLDQKGQLAVQLGVAVPSSFWPVPVANSNEIFIQAPVFLNGQSYLIVAVPILNNQSQRVGTDIAIFNLESLQQIVKDYTGLGNTGETALGVIENNTVKLFFSLRNTPNTLNIQLQDLSTTTSLGNALLKASRQESGLLYSELDNAAVIAYGPIQGSPWGFIVKIDQQELYQPINRQVIVIASLILCLILLGTGGMILLLRPLASQVIFQTDQLQQQNQEKANLLAEKTAALQLEIFQRQRIQEALQQMEHLKETSQSSAEQATHAVTGASEALVFAKKGTEAVQKTLQGMENQQEMVAAITEQILQLKEKTYQIGTIANLVSSLANQTNILALNAAVEAVRTDGKTGFGVIAKEIRNLADQSKNSATRIYTLIADIQTAIQSTVNATQAGQKSVEEGMNNTQETAEVFAGVQSSVNQVVDNNHQISLNVQQQAIAIKKVVETIHSFQEPYNFTE
jgi:hypothetical protein